jgi:hypothetical protein
MLELVLAATLMLIVLGATLTTLDEFTDSTRATELQNDSQEQARSAMDQLARELRNHAVANTRAPEGIALAEPYDLIFETVGQSRPSGSANTANVQRVRYCLDADSTLWAQDQFWTTASSPEVPSIISCPSNFWHSRRIVAEDVVNRLGGASRPLFTYDAANPAQVRRVSMSLFVDTTPGAEPKETRLQSAIFLRNANQPPAASFTATVTGSGQLILNGTESSDPESERLSYSWKIDDAAIAPATATVDYGGVPSGTHSVELTVTDPGGLFGTNRQTVAVP